jgi:hypothetical protein
MRVCKAWAWFLLVGLIAQGCSCGDDSGASKDAGPDVDAESDAGEEDSGPPEPDAEVDAGADAAIEALDIFETWQEAREALQASPDHLPARAAALIEEGDPEAIFEFVRDQIVTYPPSADGFENALYATRWGVRGTLRGGAGTPREKAELLVHLYTEAGIVAEVVRGEADPERVDGQKILLREYTRPFAPDIDPERGELWLDALGQASPNEPPARTAIDADESEANALTAQLLAALPGDLEASFDFTVTQIPLVRVEVNGESQYANPLVADADFGESLTLAEPIDAGEANPTHKIFVSLMASRANAPFDDDIVLVEREWTAEEVVGRRIHLSFRPPLATAEIVRSKAESFETFLPILSVSAPGLDGEAQDELAAIGDAVSIGGEIYHLENGELTVNGVAIAEATSDPAEIARVETVGVEAEPAAFPRVTLRVRALDGAGERVSRLDASAFTVTEDGELVSFNITRNEAPPPRIAVVFDISTSVPPEFLDPNLVPLAQDIIAGLYAATDEAELRLGVISFGTTWMGPWVGTKADADLQAEALMDANGGSELWNALRDAVDADPTLIIIVTDGDPSEPALEIDRNAVAAGPPVLALGLSGATTFMQGTLDDIAALSGGSTANITDAASAISQSIAAIDDSMLDDYILSYAASADGEAAREVSVTINDVEATTRYDVPEAPVTPPAIAGLYLTVRLPSGEVKRSVAGFSSGVTTAHVPVTQAMLDDVKAMLFGRISISVEAASPAPSIVLDDWLAEKQAIKPLYDAALIEQDEAAVLEAVEEGFTLTPPKLPLAHPPLANQRSDALTFETGLRVATMIQKTYKDGPITRNLDVFPLSRWATAAEDPRAAFEQTVTATAGLAAMEAGLLTGTSTLEALDGEALTLVVPGDARNQADLTEEEVLQWAVLEERFAGSYSLLVPHKPGPFWAIDRTTGTVIGVLPNGSGGATEDACSTHDALNNFLELFGLLGSFFEVGAFGPWVALAMWEVKYVTIATIVIGGGPGGGDFELTNPAGDMACDMAGDAIGDAIPGYGTYEDVVETLGGHGFDTGAPTLCGGGDDGPC